MLNQIMGLVKKSHTNSVLKGWDGDKDGKNPDFINFNETDKDLFCRAARNMSRVTGFSLQEVVRAFSVLANMPPTTISMPLFPCNRINITRLDSREAECKCAVVRKGDYIWIGGEKKLWRKLSKSERKWAEKEINEDGKIKPWGKEVEKWKK